VSLTKYREKRSFDKTPEPAPSLPAESAPHPLTFCIQRHHATNLHYDFRLELDGALKSWAVPKGPTLDPAEKRLAMMVEDHPLEYGGFEGVIPKGNYGAGSVMLWDRGTYETLGEATPQEQLARGDFKFRLTGQKLTGEFAIVRMKRGKGNEWLLLKKKDAFAQPGWNVDDYGYSALSGRTQEEIAQGLKAPPPSKPVDLPNVSPMLAQIGKGTPPTGPDWLYEIKWDGVRAICYIQNGRLRMVSRNGNSMDRQYPELSVLPHHIRASTAILDGEIAALDPRGLPSFELLQSRINVAEAGSIATLSRSTPVVIFLFDLLYLDGRDLRGEPLSERKRLLKQIVQQTETIRYSEHFQGTGAELLEAAKAQGLEGIVAKRASSFYESRRSDCWLKFKLSSTEEFVLCGMIKGEREPFGALALGIYDHGKLKWAGNVGTGFDRKKMDAIHARLAPLATEKCPLEPEKELPKKGVIWTRPEVVCEVRFSNWTDEGRLRAPVWMGLRPDIDPQECTRDEPATERKTLLDPAKSEEIVTVDRHRLKLTNLNKLYYPGDKIAKRDLLNYYDAVAPLLVPHLKDRPLSLKRYPNGIDADFFFQKEVAPSFPKWLHTADADGIESVIGNDRATLLFLVNLGCVDHNPWMSRIDSLENPDYMLIDLDPQDCSYEKIVEAAYVVKAKLDLAELEGYPKTTGGDGMHIFVPLAPVYTYDQVRSLAELLSTLVAAERPDLFTTPRAVAKRDKNKVYFDWQQIARGKTISAPYVLRAYPGAPVATPLAWREVTPRLRPDQFTIFNALARFDRVGDLFAPVLSAGQEIPPALEKLSAHL